MAFARHPDSSKHRGLVYRCTRCSFFGDQRALQAHVVTRHVPLEEAPYFCRVCHIKYVLADDWVRHANSNSHRVRVMVCPSPGGQTPLGRGSWALSLTGPCPDATRWGSQESKRYFELSSRARPGASKYSLADLLTTLPPAPVASRAAPEPMAQEAEDLGQSLGDDEEAPEPQKEAEELVAQESSEGVTEFVDAQPGEAAQTTLAQEPGSSIVEEALSSVPWCGEVWTGREEVVEEQFEPAILHEECWRSHLESLPRAQTPATALAQKPVETISPPSSAGQRLDGSPSVAEEPSPATSSEAAVTDGSASSAGQPRKDFNEDSTPDALSEATVTISPPSSAGQRLDGSVSVADEPSPATSSEAAVTDGSASAAGQPRKDFNEDSTPDALSEATVTISPPSSAGQRLDGSVSVADEPSPATSSEAAVTDGSASSAGQPRKDVNEDSTPDALSEATVTISPPSSAGQRLDGFGLGRRGAQPSHLLKGSCDRWFCQLCWAAEERSQRGLHTRCPVRGHSDHQPPSSAGQRLDGSVSVAEEPSPATSSEAAVTDGSASSAGQPRKDFNEDSTPDALSEATVTISPPSSAGQRLDGSV